MDPAEIWHQFHPHSIDSDSEDGSDNGMVVQLLLEDSLSEPEDSLDQIRYRSANKDRRRTLYDMLLHEDYWSANPAYSADDFKARFRLPIGLFNQIVEDVQKYDQYFVQKPSGISAEQQDDKFRMAKTTTREAMIRFCAAIEGIYADSALRKPSIEDINRLLNESYKQGWPGCIGSIDCMHWTWKNCPSAWAGMFTGKECKPTVVLEAVADSSCRFWHFFFGLPGSLNDLNVLDRSALLHDAINGRSPIVEYQVCKFYPFTD